MTELSKSTEETVSRYNVLNTLGKEIFAKSDMVKNGKVSEGDVRLADTLLSEGAAIVNPPIRALWWEHVALATEFAGRMSQQDPAIRLSMKLHDVGRWVDPEQTFRNDTIARRLYKNWGIGETIDATLFSFQGLLRPVEIFMDKGAPLELQVTDSQKQGEEQLNPAQEKIIDEFVRNLPFSHVLTFVADNLGKRTFDRKLFDLPTFYLYLQTESKKYHMSNDNQTPSRWATVAHIQKNTAALGALAPHITLSMVRNMLERLQQSGIDVQGIHRSLEDVGPKFVLLIRHGDIINPSGLDYGQDEFMRPDEIVTLSDTGKKQMEQVSSLIKERMLPGIKTIITSPAKRVRDSAAIVRQKLDIPNSQVDQRVNEVYSPGAYLERIPQGELEKKAADPDWLAAIQQQYQHEKLPDVTTRISATYTELLATLQKGETGIIVSHGIPLQLLRASLNNYPDQDKQPPKGSVTLVVIDQNNKPYISYYLR